MTSIVVDAVAAAHPAPAAPPTDSYPDVSRPDLDDRAAASRARELLAVLAVLVLIAGLRALMVASTAL